MKSSNHYVYIKYLKYFENGGKNMSFLIKNKLDINFHSQPIYENKYLKARVRESDGSIKTNFLCNNLPKENTHYACIACITIDSIIKMKKKIIHKFI